MTDDALGEVLAWARALPVHECDWGPHAAHWAAEVCTVCDATRVISREAAVAQAQWRAMGLSAARDGFKTGGQLR